MQICPECEHVRLKSFTLHSLQETCLGSLPAQSAASVKAMKSLSPTILLPSSTLSMICQSVSLKSHYLHRLALSTAILFVPAQLSWLNAKSEQESSSAVK